MKLRMKKTVGGFYHMLVIEVEMNRKVNYMYNMDSPDSVFEFTYSNGYFHFEKPIDIGIYSIRDKFKKLKCPKNIRYEIEEYNIESFENKEK